MLLCVCLQQVQRHSLWVLRRPWEAPEHVLQDAGVELGVNYPYPVVSAEESEAALARASDVIQQSIVTHNSDVRPVILLPTLRPLILYMKCWPYGLQGRGWGL